MVQVNKVVEDGGGVNSHGGMYSFLLESIQSSQPFVGAIVVVIILVYAVIHVKRAGLALATKDTIYSDPSSDTIIDYKRRNTVKLHRFLGHSFVTTFFRRIPNRLWNFYIKSFLIPHYRKEWGKYRVWCFRSPVRHRKVSFEEKGQTKSETLDSKSFPLNVDEAAADELDPHVKPVAHNHAGCRRVRINVGGCIYETQERTLSRYPESLLGDPNKRLRFFNPIDQEYFFDRNRASFETILYFYQSGGKFKRPETVSADVLLDDAKYYGLPESVICQYLRDEGLSVASEGEDILPKNLFMRKIWLLFDYPGSSMQAQIVSLISILAITLSISTFCIETLDSLDDRYRYFFDSTDGTVYDASTGTISEFDLEDPFFFTESVCTLWFLVEYLVRFATSPVKKDFFTSTLNIIDLIAVLPYFVQIVLPPDEEDDVNHQRLAVLKNRRQTGSVSLIRVVRLVRVFRIFKLSRHSRGLKILGKTLQASFNELILLIFFVLIGVVLFSSTMYFAELGSVTTPFQSIPDGFWWALITITTVGYGDVVPKTVGGKIVGALCAVAGVLTLALPVPVIVSNFNFFYHQALGETDLSWIKIYHSPPCPFRPTSLHTDDEPPPLNSKQRKSQKRGTILLPKKLGKLARSGKRSSSDSEFEILKVENTKRRSKNTSKKVRVSTKLSKDQEGQLKETNKEQQGRNSKESPSATEKIQEASPSSVAVANKIQAASVTKTTQDAKKK